MIKLGIGNYGMKAFDPLEALRHTARIGYEAVELTMMPGWPTEPTALSKEGRRRLAEAAENHGLMIPSLLEQIPLVVEGRDRATNLDRLRRDAELAHDLSPGSPPVIQTHLGGRSRDWPHLKEVVVERLMEWIEVARETATGICIKVHHRNLMDTVDKAVWVMERTRSPWLRLLYDYSHMEVSGETLERSMDLLLPYTEIISVKDSNRNPEDFQRLLPGDGDIDYVDYFGRLSRFGYRGCIMVEVSGQFHKKPDYDPIGVAERCYSYLDIIRKTAVAAERGEG